MLLMFFFSKHVHFHLRDPDQYTLFRGSNEGGTGSFISGQLWIPVPSDFHEDIECQFHLLAAGKCIGNRVHPGRIVTKRKDGRGKMMKMFANGI